MLHLVISIVNKSFVIKWCGSSFLQNIIGLLLVIWNALDCCDWIRSIERKPIMSDKHLFVICSKILSSIHVYKVLVYG